MQLPWHDASDLCRPLLHPVIKIFYHSADCGDTDMSTLAWRCPEFFRNPQGQKKKKGLCKVDFKALFINKLPCPQEGMYCSDKACFVYMRFVGNLQWTEAHFVDTGALWKLVSWTRAPAMFFQERILFYQVRNKIWEPLKTSAWFTEARLLEPRTINPRFFPP